MRKTIRDLGDRLCVYTPLTFSKKKDGAICDRLLSLPENAKVAAVIRDMCRNGVSAALVKEDETEVELGNLGEEL